MVQDFLHEQQVLPPWDGKRGARPSRIISASPRRNALNGHARLCFSEELNLDSRAGQRIETKTMHIHIYIYMGGCQNHGPFLGSLNTRGRIIIGTQKGTTILTTTHIYIYIYTHAHVCTSICVYIYICNIINYISMKIPPI